MNGAGNDFIIINNLTEHLSPDAFPALARTLCHRHLSIGADGLMAVLPSGSGCDFKMLYYNSDGSQGCCFITPTGARGRCAAMAHGVSAATATKTI